MEIEVIMDNGVGYTWTVTTDMEYEFSDRFFVVKKGDRWVGMYAKDHVLAVEVRKWS